MRFVSQACRGDQVDDGAKVVGRSLIQKDASASGSYTIPVMADILVMYSTYEGKRKEFIKYHTCQEIFALD